MLKRFGRDLKLDSWNPPEGGMPTKMRPVSAIFWLYSYIPADVNFQNDSQVIFDSKCRCKISKRLFSQTIGKAFEMQPLHLKPTHPTQPVSHGNPARVTFTPAGGLDALSFFFMAKTAPSSKK